MGPATPGLATRSATPPEPGGGALRQSLGGPGKWSPTRGTHGGGAPGRAPPGKVRLGRFVATGGVNDLHSNLHRNARGGDPVSNHAQKPTPESTPEGGVRVVGK